MASLVHLIRNHLQYSQWASVRLLNAAVQLTAAERQRDFGTADKSVEGTLLHLLQSERIWFARVQKGTGADASRLFSGGLAGDQRWEQLNDEWQSLYGDWHTWAESLTEDGADAPLTYLDLKGVQWTTPLWQVVLHVVNHSTHHRGQVSGFLRSLGKTPPPLDFIAYTRQLGSR